MVMKHVDWNKEYPEVPDLVHQSVLDALSALEEQEVRKMKRIPKKRVILLAAALVVLAGTTAAASGIFRWNERAGQIFEADEDTRNELTMSQLAQDMSSQFVSDQGLTVTAIQTIQDRNRFYALFEVTAEDPDMKITSDCMMEYTMDFGGKEDPFGALSWGFVSEADQVISNTRYFEIDGVKNKEFDENLIMNIHFTNLLGEPSGKSGEKNVLISGNWDFTLNIRTSDMISHEINREYQLDGYSMHILSVSFSPLSMEIVYDGKDVRTMEAGKEIRLDQMDELTALYPTGVRYADGTIIDEGLMLPLLEGFRNGEESYGLILPFDKVIDPEQVEAFLIGDESVIVSHE